MRRILFLCFSCVLFVAPSIASETENIDYSQAIININQKINTLNKELNNSQNEIETLQEKLRVAEQKIIEIFKTLEFKIIDKAVKDEIKTTIKIQEESYMLYSNAREYLKLRHYDNAIDLFEIYIEKYKNQKNYIDSQYWLAKSLYFNKSYKEAEEILLKFQKENPLHARYPDSLYNLAEILIKLSKIEQAKQMLYKIIEKFPNHSLSIRASSKIEELEVDNQEN